MVQKDRKTLFYRKCPQNLGAPCRSIVFLCKDKRRQLSLLGLVLLFWWALGEGKEWIHWHKNRCIWDTQLSWKEVRFDSAHPCPLSLPFLVFPDVLIRVQALAHKGYHHSSPLHRIATESFKSHCKTINSNWSSLTILLWHQPIEIVKKLGYYCDIQFKIIPKIMTGIIYQSILDFVKVSHSFVSNSLRPFGL